MRFPLLAALAAASFVPLARAQPFTAAEIRQGYSNCTIIAKPRATLAGADIANAEQREGRRTRQVFTRLGNLTLIEPAAGEKIDAAIRRMRASGRYEFVEPDYLKRRHALPNDPRFVAGDQWALQNTGLKGGVIGADISAVAAWDKRTDASGLVVAVIDTGIRATHEDLVGNLWTNPKEIPDNGIDDDHNGYVDDVHGINALAAAGSLASGRPDDDVGHGTLVSGVIAAAGNNGQGVAGVAWKAQIMALKFDDAEGSASTSKEIECIDYAIANGARVINISYGGFDFSQTEYEAVKRARDAGVIIVASAGNDGLNTDLSPVFPASYLLDNVVAVAATDRLDGLASFSNYNVGLVDLGAPGSEILSTERTSDTAYGAHDGTSFSSPMVAGALALVATEFPGENYRGIMNRLFRAVDARPSLAGKVQTGGRLNVARALNGDSNRPFNDDFAARAALTGANVTLRANSRYATAEPGEPAHAGITSAATLWWSWTAPANGTAVADTAGSNFDTVVAVYTGSSLPTLTVVSANDDVTGSLAGRVSFTATAGATYQIAVCGKGSTTGGVVLSVGIAPPNDNFADATALSGSSVRVSGFNTVSGPEFGEPKPATSAAGKSVWYKWLAPSSGTYSFSVFAYGFDAAAAVYTGSSLGGLGRLKAASTQDYNEPGTFTASVGRTYYFQIDSVDGNTGQFDFTLVDGVAIPDYVPNDPSPVVDTATSTIFTLNTYGVATAVDLDAQSYKFAELDGTVDVQSPALGADGHIYVGDEVGYLYSFDHQLTQLWKKDLGLTSVTSSLGIAADGTVYVHTDDGNLHAYTAKGVLRWRGTVPGASYSAPSIGDDGTIYIGSDDENLYALSPLDGALQWKFKADGQIYTSPAIDASGNVYFATLNGKVYSVTAAGVERWNFTAGGPVSSSPTLGLDGSVYFGSYDHKLYALTADGRLRWTYSTGDEIRASTPAISSFGIVYIGSYDGYVHAVNTNGVLQRKYATGAYIRSSPAIYEGTLLIGSGDARTYLFQIDASAASSAWPMHRQNLARAGRRIVTSIPKVASLSGAQVAANGAPATLAVNATGSSPMTFQWQFNGTPVADATDSSLTVPATTSAQTGLYTATINNANGTAATAPMIVGLTSTAKVIGAGSEVAHDIVFANGNVFDQVLLQGAAATVTADPGQVLRISYVDKNDDIVQVEFSGAGALSLVLDAPSGPAAPVNYNQPAVSYMKGQAGIVVTGANETTNLSVFSVGRANAANQALFKDNVGYDGLADIAFVAIQSSNGKFGGLRTSNARYSAAKGATGLYAPGVQFTGPVFVGDINAQDKATPYLVIGAGDDVRVTGGDMLQSNARAVVVSGLTQLKFTAGSTSHGSNLPAQNNQGRFEQDGADVTNKIVLNPTP